MQSCAGSVDVIIENIDPNTSFSKFRLHHHVSLLYLYLHSLGEKSSMISVLVWETVLRCLLQYSSTEVSVFTYIRLSIYLSIKIWPL